MLQRKCLIDEAIGRQLAITKKSWDQMAATFFEQVELNHFDTALKVFYEVLTEYNQKAKLKWLTGALDSASFKLKTAVFNETALPILKNKQKIIVKKDYEIQHQQNVLNQWIQERSIFFTQKINAKLTQTRATLEIQQKIMALFLEEQSCVRLDNLGELQRYKQQIKSLKQLLGYTSKWYQRLRECWPLQQIIRSNLDTLKVINICYKKKVRQQNFNYQCRYSISAFELFRVVHANKLLNQVSLKGVQVCYFQKFTKLLRRALQSQSVQQFTEQNNDLCWMKSFNPQKPLKLSIDATVQFEIQKQQDSLSKIDDLSCFGSLFSQLSDITAQLKLGNLSQIIQWVATLQQLWQCLKIIKSIKLKIQSRIQTHGYMPVSIIRSALFGELASFTQITQLQFSNIAFQTFRINDFLAIEKILQTLFTNNAVSHLSLDNCREFPILPLITTLKSIRLCRVSFKVNFGFMSEVVQNNRSLRYIKLVQMSQKLEIDEQLFNQLETLSIQKCRKIYFANILSNSPSNIKNLCIYDTYIGRVDCCLFVIFSKLSNLLSLKLGKIDFKGELLRSIPSLRLEQLHIWDNKTITDKCFQVIDSKWPFLRALSLNECNKIRFFWSGNKFKGLMQLDVNRYLKGFILSDLKRRGIQVNYLRVINQAY